MTIANCILFTLFSYLTHCWNSSCALRLCRLPLFPGSSLYLFPRLVMSGSGCAGTLPSSQYDSRFGRSMDQLFVCNATLYPPFSSFPRHMALPSGICGPVVSHKVHACSVPRSGGSPYRFETFGTLRFSCMPPIMGLLVAEDGLFLQYVVCGCSRSCLTHVCKSDARTLGSDCCLYLKQVSPWCAMRPKCDEHDTGSILRGTVLHRLVWVL